MPKAFGINVEGTVAPDFKAVMERKAKVVSGLVKGIEYLNANNVTMIKGTGVC